MEVLVDSCERSMELLMHDLVQQLDPSQMPLVVADGAALIRTDSVSRAAAEAALAQPSKHARGPVGGACCSRESMGWSFWPTAQAWLDHAPEVVPAKPNICCMGEALSVHCCRHIAGHTSQLQGFSCHTQIRHDYLGCCVYCL